MRYILNEEIKGVRTKREPNCDLDNSNNSNKYSHKSDKASEQGVIEHNFF